MAFTKTGFVAILLLAGLLVRLIYTHFHTRRQMRLLGCHHAPHSLVRTREPFLGLDFLLTTTRAARAFRYLDLQTERFRQYGATFVTHRLLYDTISTNEPANLQHMLGVAFSDFGFTDVRVRVMSPLFGNGIFTAEGPVWHTSRQLLRPAVKKHNMAPLLRMLERHFITLRDRLVAVDKDQTVDLQPLFFALTMDTATEFLLGRSTHTLDPARSSEREAAFVRDYLACCIEAVRLMRLSPLRPFWRDARFETARQRAWAYVDTFVDEAIRMRDSEKDKLNVQQEEGVGDNDNDNGNDNDDEYSVEYNFLREIAREHGDRDFLRDQVLNVLLASRDTTAGLLSNLFFVLARRPDVYQKLRAEVGEHFGDSELPTHETLKKATYLDWCLKESLRLHPVVPFNGRQALRDTYLPLGGGPDGKDRLFVKKGTPVLYYVWALHRREDIFGPEPELFRPERWQDLRPGWGYLPFSGGARTCIGRQFALTEAAYVVVRMLQCFSEITPRDSRPWTEKHTLAICSRYGVQCSLKSCVS